METKNKIINAAYGLFANKGMEFTLNEAAEVVGIKKASIYAHFSSKEELLYRLFNEEMDEYFVAVEQSSRTLKELYFGIINYYGSSKEKLLFWKRLLLFPPDTMKSEVRQRMVELSEARMEKVKVLIRDEFFPGTEIGRNIDRLAVMFLSLIHGLLSSEIIYSGCFIEDYLSEEWVLFEKILKSEV